MKKGLLRALSAVVAISMLFCMSMVAFADVTAVTSVTNYDVVSGNVTVRTEVNGVPSGEQVAFLVEKTTGENTEIIWIDQQPATGSVVTSSFTASVNAAENAKVRVGTTSTAASQINEGTVTLPNYTVNWTIEGSQNDAKVIAVIDEQEVNKGATTTDYVTFYVVPGAGEELKSVAYGTTTEGAFVGDSKTYGITADTTFTFTFGAKVVADDDANTNADDTVVAVVGNADVYDAETGTASVTATATYATDFGIVVAKAGYDFNTNIPAIFGSLNDVGGEGADAVKLPALGADAQGRFVIVIEDANRDFFVEGIDYVAKVYAVRNDGSAPVLSTETFALN